MTIGDADALGPLLALFLVVAAVAAIAAHRWRVASIPAGPVWIELCISDDGRGFDPTCVSSGRLGLGIIRECSRAVGAMLNIESQLGAGTAIEVVWNSREAP